jgi:periplasmic protein CpxP/Spy
VKNHVARFLIASSLALGVPLAVHAQATPDRTHAQMHGQHGQGGPQRLLRRLDLTEAQRDQVFKIFHDQAPAMREQMKVARRASQELRQASLSPNFDRARARQLADTQAKALSEVALMRADNMSRVVAILTPDQRSKLQQLREGGERRGRG